MTTEYTTTEPRIPVVFDMETQDPDDFLALLLLLGHPSVELRAVTITPGSPAQVGFVRRALEWFGREDVRVGAHNLDHPKECMSSWHAKAYGAAAPSRDAEDAGRLLLEVCDAETTLITGAPLKNLTVPAADPGFVLGRWVAQGGFAGEGVVPPELQLEKFKGMRTVATFNFNGAPKAALAALAHPGIGSAGWSRRTCAMGSCGTRRCTGRSLRAPRSTTTSRGSGKAWSATSRRSGSDTPRPQRSRRTRILTRYAWWAVASARRVSYPRPKRGRWRARKGASSS